MHPAPARPTRRALLGAGLGVAALALPGCSAGISPQRVGRLPELLTGPGWVTGVVDDSFGRDGAVVGGQSLTPQQWLARGRVPGAGTRWEAMAVRALLDVKQLMHGNGSVSAGPAVGWGFSWSRDNAFAVGAMLAARHRSEALQILDFMRFVQLPNGGFLPRDLLTGGAPDRRHAQSDGAGWALWATAHLLDTPPEPARDQLDAPGAPRIAATSEEELRPWMPMVNRAVAFIARDLRTGGGLPTPSSDYWERREARLTLGTAAALLLGLRSARRLLLATGWDRRADNVAGLADHLEDRLHDAFGPAGYQRYSDRGGPDAAVCWLLPPFADHVRPAVLDAWHAYQRDAARPAGGLAPGVGWKQDGISWTPEVAQVALTAGPCGRPDVAEHWLDWLDATRVDWGSLPEKVRPDGLPAGPAPLGWTASTVLLTLAARENR
ncbi:glycoside hydrolase family 15 [Kineococcus gynurae]|uniref:Glycoside hydrolase family 15 n=1 Tax=Kineococcus gynurae TaxID=452979 RepID=A0ABV5LPP8_9ACTN